MNTQNARLAGIALSLIGGLAVAASNDGLMENPPPAAPLKGYATYELKPLRMEAPYAGQPANDKAAAKIQEHINTQIEPIAKAWSAAGSAAGAKGTLVIEPLVEEIKFIGGNARFWAGALAGSSYVLIKLNISEKDSGKTLATPEFFQRAAAMSGAWTMGSQDNDMLQRIVTVANQYLSANYDAAVGGRTGREQKKKK